MEKWPKLERDYEGDPPLPEREARAEKRDRLHAELREKIGVVTRIRTALERRDLDGTAMAAAADKIIGEAEQKYSPAAEEKIKAVGLLIKRREKINEAFDRSVESGEDDAASLAGESEKIFEEITRLNADPDVQLVRALRRGREGLLRKANSYEEAKNNPESQKLPEKSGLKEILSGKTPIFSGLSLSYILTDAEMEKLGYDRGTQGIHFPDSVIDLIRDSGDAEENEEVLRHEAAHSVYEAFLRQKADGEREVKRDVASFRRLARKEASDYLFSLKISALPKRIAEFVYSAKGELVANFGELAKGNLHTELSEFRYATSFLQSEKKRTADSLARKNRSEDARTLDYLQEYERRLTALFRGFYEELGDLFFIADREEKLGELKSAMILFDPGEYRKISRFFKDEIGNDKYDFYLSLRRLTREPFFNGQSTGEERILDEIYGNGKRVYWESEAEAVISAIETNPELLTERTRKDLRSVLEAIDDNPKIELEAGRNAENCKNSCELMKKMGKILGSGVEEYLAIAIGEYLNSAFEDAATGRNGKLNEALSELGAEYDKFILDFLASYAREAAEDFGGEKGLFSSGLWKALLENSRTSGAAARIEKSFAEN